MDSTAKMKFPDEYFPVRQELTQDFENKVNKGKQFSKNLKILFCATCKDVAKVVGKSISFCDYVGSHFKDYDIFLYENNSSDNTPEVIKSLNNNKIILQSEFIDNASYKRSNVTQFDRCSFISNARNKYVEYINKNQDYDYIFVFDTDIEGGWSIDGIFNSISYLQNNNDIGAMTSYCVLASARGGDLEEKDPRGWIMFDSFAFRYYNETDWSFPDNLHEYNHIRITRGDEPVPVNSNFNGLALYKPECFVGNKYQVNSHGSDFRTDSEHVSFHRNIWNKGLKVLINPSMLTSISNHKYSK